jgi:hypothetical protein
LCGLGRGNDSFAHSGGGCAGDGLSLLEDPDNPSPIKGTIQLVLG